MFLFCFQSAIASEERIGRVGRRCFTVWVYLRNQSKKKRGTPWKMCIWLHWQTVFTFYAFFIWWDGTLLDSELWLFCKSMSSTVDFCFLFLFSHENERVCAHVCVHAFICINESHKHPHLMDLNGLKFRAMQGPCWVLLWDVHTMWRSEVIFVKFYILSLL